MIGIPMKNFWTMLLPTLGDEKVRGWCGLQWHNMHAKFRENRYTGSKHERGHKEWQFHKPTFFS